EILLDTRMRASTEADVAGTAGPISEGAFFDGGPGDPLNVIGLRAIVQDETYGTAAIVSAARLAGLEMLGTYPERRGLGAVSGASAAGAASEGRVWARLGASATDTDDGVSFRQDLEFGQAGI